jgi:hypothetical protein
MLVNQSYKDAKMLVICRLGVVSYPVYAIWFIAPKHLNYLLSHRSILSVPSDGHSRNAFFLLQSLGRYLSEGIIHPVVSVWH